MGIDKESKETGKKLVGEVESREDNIQMWLLKAFKREQNIFIQFMSPSVLQCLLIMMKKKETGRILGRPKNNAAASTGTFSIQLCSFSFLLPESEAHLEDSEVSKFNKKFFT